MLSSLLHLLKNETSLLIQICQVLLLVLRLKVFNALLILLLLFLTFLAHLLCCLVHLLNALLFDLFRLKELISDLKQVELVLLALFDLQAQFDRQELDTLSISIITVDTSSRQLFFETLSVTRVLDALQRAQISILFFHFLLLFSAFAGHELFQFLPLLFPHLLALFELFRCRHSLRLPTELQYLIFCLYTTITSDALIEPIDQALGP